MSSAYLFLYVLERAWTNNGKANEENVCLRIWERSKAIVIFLTWKENENNALVTPEMLGDEKG